MKVNTSNSLDLIEVLDLLISDLFLNSSETSLMSINSNSLKDSLFYVSRAKPSISFKDYMRRFQRFTKCSNEIFLIGFIYFDRIIQKNNLIHNRINVHKLMIVSLIIASKYQEDIANNNMFFSKCSGIRNDDLCSMEIEYLELIEYSLFIYPKEFENLLLNLNALFQMKDD